MKIAFIGQKGIPAVGGGVERYVEDLSVRIASYGHEVTVYTRPNYTSKYLLDYQGVSLLSLPTIPSKHLDAISHSFLATIHAAFKKVDVIHYQSIGPALTAWLPKIINPKVKIVSTLQSRDYQHQKWGTLARFMLRLGEKFMCRFSDEVLVITESMKDYVEQSYGLSPKVIPNGANLYEVIGRDDLLKDWGLKKDNYLVAISRLIRHKGLGYLIEAFKQIKTDKRLVIVGEGSFTDDYVAELKELAKDDQRIIFTGNQTGETLAQLYENACLFIQPSESEGLSLALLEAMARRKAVLVSDIPENAEVVAEAGFSFKNRDVNDLVTKLNNILANEEELQTKGLLARERVANYYNWEDIAAKINGVYKEVLLGKKTPKAELNNSTKVKTA